jgi:filamentous hemagglutinin
MNKHCGRTIFNKIRGCLMAVSESAKGHGNARGCSPATTTSAHSGWIKSINTLALSAMLAQTTLAPLSAYAQIRNDATAPGHQRPTVLTTGNGLPQVNITTPSAAGVSRNQFSQLDVDNRGAVINNSRINAPTQIGGWVQGNPWLASGEARVILMEVNSQNPSNINGFLEIAGQRSEIIVANPAGLNVNGSGFINASRATLTTGEVNVGESGVTGYTVRGGTVTIGNQGFDASLTDYTGILARAVAVNGPLAAQELNIVTGANQIAATGRGATPTTGSGARPSFAIDVSNLGGMYAGKISLLATEAGVGVRNAGGIQAGSGGLSLAANGDLVNQGNLASQGDASLNNAGRFDNSGNLTASGALDVNASSLSNSGQIGAGSNAQINTSGAIDNSGTVAAGGNLAMSGAQLNNEGSLGAGNEMVLAVTGQFNNSGSVSASGSLNVNAVNIDSSGQISGGGLVAINATNTLNNSGDISAGTLLDLQGAQVDNAGTLNAGQQLNLSSAGRFDNDGQIVSQGSVNLSAPQGIGNAGAIESQNAVSLTTSGAVSNSGQIIAATDTSINATGALDNTGGITAGTDLIVSSGPLSNTGTLSAGQRANINATGGFNNQGDLTAINGLQVNATEVNNNGSVLAGNSIQILASGTLSNNGDFSATSNVAIQATQMANAGSLSAGQQLNLASAGPVDNSGQITAGEALDIDATHFNSSGTITAGTNAQITASGELNNSGDISAVANLSLQGAQLANSGSLNAGELLSLSSDGRFDNDGSIVVQGGIGMLAPDGIGNTGDILSQRDILLETAAEIDNSGYVVADGALSIQAGTTVTNSGGLMGDQGVTVQGAQTLDNQGTVFSGGQTTIVVADHIDNQGLIVADGDMQLQSGQRIDNRSNAQIYAAGQLQATTGQAITNEGILGAGQDAQVTTLATNGTISSTASSVLAAGMNPTGDVLLGGGTLTLQAGSAGHVDLKGITLGGRQIQAQAGSIDLRGQDLLSEQIHLQATQGDILAQDSSLQAAQRLQLDATGQLRTDNALLGANQIGISAAQWTLQDGLLQQAGTAAADAQINVGESIDLSGATVAANAEALTLVSQDLQLNGTTLTHAGNGRLQLQSQGPATVLANDALLSTGGTLQLDAAALQAERSFITAQNDANLHLAGALTATDGTILANGALTLQAGSLSANGANLVGVSGNAQLNIAGAASVSGGSVQSEANVTINAQSLDSSDGLIAGLDIDINTHGGALNNADGAVLALDTLTINSGALDNQRGVMQGSGDVNIVATGVVNNQSGQILSESALNLSSSGAINNQTTTATRATIAAAQDVTITAQGLNNQGSDIKSAADLEINAGSGSINNSQGALIAASGDLTMTGGALSNQQTNGANQGIQAKAVDLTVSSLNNTSGALLAQDQMAITTGGALNNTGGLISSTGALSLTDPLAASNPAAKTLDITNGAGGIIAANGATEINARSLDNSGIIANAGDATEATAATPGSGNIDVALSGALTNRAGGIVQATEHLSVVAAGGASNAGTIESGSELHLATTTLDNQATGSLRAGLVDLQASTLQNQGLINGAGFTLIQAGTVNNTHAGRIYGGDIAIAANQLNNRGGSGTDPVIASRGDLDLAVGVVNNTDNALLLSLGDTRVGGSLDANAHATGRAGAFINGSADVEVFGNLTINAGNIGNVDAHGTSYSSSTTEHVLEYLPNDADHPNLNTAFSAATGAINWYLERDDQYVAGYFPADGSAGVLANQWFIDEYDRTTTVSGNYGNDPARMSVGGNITFNASNATNDKSSILAGGNFLMQGGSLQNIDGYRSTSITEDNGTRILSYTERGWYDWSREWRRYFSDPGVRTMPPTNTYTDIPSTVAFHTNPNHGSARPGAAQAVSVASLASAPDATTSATLASNPSGELGQSGPGVVVRTLPAGVGSGSNVSGNGATAGAVNAPNITVPADGDTLARALSSATIPLPASAPPISLPSNALFQLRLGNNATTGKPSGYLVETDPEFTLQRQWLGSEYMLTALGYDPATVTQRLGDGFYEQKLVREQVAQLTGRRFLGTFTDDEAQYRALLDAGTAFGQAYQLKPGIALSPAQMALLTSDIVWLVAREVVLPDGTTQRVLAPQLYALVDPATGSLSSGLISANGININLTGGLFNSGMLAARENLAINAQSITNVLGQMAGNNIDLRASGGITSILGQIAARQNLNMSAGGDMVFVGGGISAGGNARLSAGGNLSLIAYDTGKQIRAHSPRDEEGNPVGKGPVWSMENSTYNQTGVSIDVGGSLKASAGGNLFAQGVNANVGGSTSLSAGGDMQLTTALNGHVNTFNFFNRYKNSGGLVKVEHSINRSDTNLTNSGNTWSSGGAVNLSSGGDMSLVGAQINGQGFTPRAGGNYEERAAYDIKEKVNVESVKNSGMGVYIADFINTTSALATGGAVGGKSETARTETHIDSTRTAVLTRIDAGSGTVTRSAGGDAYIEGSVVRGAVVNPLTAGGVVTAVAAVDTRHVEDSVFTSTIRWQSTKSTGSVEQTLHLPQIYGTIPEGASAYQGAGGVSVQLPAGADVRTAIETLSKEPGKEYLKELGNRSDVDWQRVEALNKSLDFSKSGLTPEATIAVIVVVSILTYGAASSAGTAAAGSMGFATTTTAGVTTMATTGGAIAAGAITAGVTSLAATTAVSLINNKGDIGAVLKELGSKENAQGLLLTMATAGLTQGILNAIPITGADGAASTLASVDANSSFGLLMARNTVQGISSAVLESAVLGTDLEDALKNNLQGALINTGAALGANAIGNAAQGANGIDATSKAIAHALLGCAVGSANAGNISGCAPGAAGAVIGELVAGWYASSTDYDTLKIDANKEGASAEIKQQFAIASNTMTELAKLTGAGGALLIGGDATTMNLAMTTAQNAAQNNRQLHVDERAWAQNNASLFRDFYEAETGQTISVEQANQMLLSAEYAVTDDAARNTGKSDALASRFIAENAPKDLLNTTAAERANPLLGGNADGSWSPEQQARFGVANVSAWSSQKVQRAESVLAANGTCGNDVSCGARKVAAVGDAFAALNQQKALYQDNQTRVQQIEAEQVILLSKLTAHDLEQAQLAAADADFMLNLSAIGAVPSALKGTASFFQRMGVGTQKIVLPEVKVFQQAQAEATASVGKTTTQVPGEASATMYGRTVTPQGQGTLFHGTNRETLGLNNMSIEQAAQYVKTNGLAARGTNIELKDHVAGLPDTAFRGTTSELGSMNKDAGALYWAGEDGLVIEVVGVKGYDINALKATSNQGGGLSGWAQEKALGGELEISIPAQVKPANIGRVGKTYIDGNGVTRFQWITGN